ncbi:signal-induced proliferation-associated 1-like protein 2 isoform X1 [Myxocyprinus asiaticus]|uniref:signal-induced proliferation-associated 1-like protein 2 isoform X1 n=1 Tax=Myxocyprinus asiaticus TaxID=70543 RepID=UPI0022237374|nr:signal-induced proliferation-associated 1-like protein 2 isoform X1 [Myxocyprinus asiaticus]
MQTDDLFAKKLQALNGNMGPPSTNTQGTPAMPKMGVRARVSDWPQRKDGNHGPPPRYDSLMTTFQNGLPSQSSEDVVKQSPGSPPNPSFLEAKYGFVDILSHSPGKVHHPLQKRSNSDVTISDIGAEDMDQTAVNPNTGASLHREYGSTSSINRQGLTDEGFFSNLKGIQPELSEQPSAPPPHGFQEFRQYKTTLSPSLQTAAQIASGDILCIPNYADYVDSSLFYSREKEKSLMQRQKSEKCETSIFRRLKTMKSEQRQLTEHDDCSRHGRQLSFQRCFAHYDVQSVLFNISEAVTNRANLACGKNITTGASAASQLQVVGGVLDSLEPLSLCESPLDTCEELGQKACTDLDEGDGKSNGLVLSCPYFRNEIGGEGERKLGAYKPNSIPYNNVGETYSIESTLSSHCTNAGVSVLELHRENYASRENYAVPRDCLKRYIIEHIDMGAYYYHKFFFNKEHQNYFGVDENLGPVAVSIRREKLEEAKEGAQFNYRVIFRTSKLTTLRGSILEDAVPSTAKHGTSRGLPLKEVLEYVVPELNIQCLRLATSSPKVPEQLLKLDQQGLSYQHKVGILYCQAGQSTEEEMYNNESGSPALDEFLDLLGQRVRLKGFSKFRAQLDNKTDSTGTHSLYTTYKDFELMFHVSTMLPYTPNNRQQLLRKRHIGNDIVTIIFQEPGAFPFTPQNIRSHFQHVFIIVKVHNPCTEQVCYSVAVARSKDVPAFGPLIPKGVMFPKSAVFRDFLLAKVINGENAAHKSEKFRAMATRTRQEYLKDLAENLASATPVDPTGAKFSFITLGAKRKERSRPRINAHLHSTGAITWSVVAQDSCQSTDIGCLLAVSREFVALIEEASKEVVFNCYCRDVIGWSCSSMVGRVKLFYERGDCVVFSVQDGCPEEVREITQRLEMVTRGCETLEMTLRRNGLGQLGFHVNFEGVVADVEPFGFAWQAGLRPGCRLVEICKVAVGTLTHEQMIDLLRTSTPVTVVVIKPHEDGTPRRGASELYRVPIMEYKALGTGPGWHRMTHVPQALPLSRVSPTQAPDRPSPGQQMFQYAQAAISRSTSFDKKYQDGSRVLQDFEMVQSPPGNPSQHYCSSPSNQSTSSDPGPCGTWAQKASYDGSQSPALHDQPEEKEVDGHRDREHKLERTRSAGSPCVPEAKWHIPSTKILNRGLQRQGAKDLPGKFPRSSEKSCHSHCSSHSSNNTLSSNTSSGSDEKHFGSGDPMDPESLGLTYIKGASTDSGIDTAPCMPPPPPSLPLPGVGPSRMVMSDGRVEAGLPWVLEYHDEGKAEEGRVKMFLSQGYAPATATGLTTDGSTGDLSEISSLSSGSRHSGSPSERCSKNSGSMDPSKIYIISPTDTNFGGGREKCPHSCQSQGGMYLAGWKKGENEHSLEEQQQASDFRRQYLTDPSHVVNAGEKVQTLSKEDFLRMLLPDSPPGQTSRCKIPIAGQSPRRSLYRTLSDESLCSSHRRALSLASSHSSMLDQAVPNDILFSSALPYHSTLPPRMRLNHTAGQLKNELWFSDGSLAEKAKLADTGLMPLPHPYSGLDWSRLVDAARAFEDQTMASLSSLTEEEQNKQVLELSKELNRRVRSVQGSTLEAGEGFPSLLTGKVNQLELILRQLQYDLRKEQEDKAMLQEQVQHLRQDNLRLHEESQTAAAQLRRFTELFLNTMDQKP